MVCAVALAFAAPAVSYASNLANNTTQVAVRYHDLDLNKSADAAILLKRVDAAATEACGASPFSAAGYRQAVRRSACHQAATNRVVAALNAPTVTALYSTQAVRLAGGED